MDGAPEHVSTGSSITWPAVVASLISGVVAILTLVIKEIIAPSVTHKDLVPAVENAIQEPKIVEDLRARIGEAVIAGTGIPVPEQAQYRA